jgi:3-methyladenine DNA glycosylase AlkD
MLHPSKARVTSPGHEAARVKRLLRAMARPAGRFDASRYFRGDDTLQFYNVGTEAVRAMAKALYRDHRHDWSVADALAFANVLIKDRHLEVKSVGIEVLARYRQACTPRLLSAWKQWLAKNYSSNWATTDAICGSLIGPLLLVHPALAPQVAAWSRHRNLWVRRASAVSLIPLVRRRGSLDLAYAVARRLQADREDLIQKAVGWMLREAGKVDPLRLERYLRRSGHTTPRTTLRYAIERFPEPKRQLLLRITRQPTGTAGDAG